MTKLNEPSKNVRVPNIRATNVLRCSNAPDSKADSKSVRISEISQQMPEIPDFFFLNVQAWLWNLYLGGQGLFDINLHKLH